MLLVVLAAGCGSSKAKVSSALPTTAPPGTSAGSTTTAAAGSGSIAAAQQDAAAIAQLPAAIKSKGSLTVALDASYAPDEFIDTDGKTVIGMDADMITAIGQVLGLSVSLGNVKFDAIIPGLASGKYDVGASSFTPTLDRQKTVDFVTYFQAGEGYYISANSTKTYNGLDSLCGAKVAVEKTTTEESDAQAQTKKCTAAGKGAIDVQSYDDQNAANLAVSSGRADVGFLDSQVAAYVVAQSKEQFKQVGTPFSTAPYGMAVPKGGGMAQPMLAAVKDLIASGIYAKILDKWALKDGAITSPVINGATS